MPTKILVVDPDATTGAWLKALLTREGYDADAVSRSEDVFTAIHQTPPALVILERDLPNQDGLALIPQIRALAPEVWLIIFTTRGSSADRIAGLSAGADDYITKQRGADVELLTKIRGLLLQPKQTPSAAPQPAPVRSETRGKIFSFISAKGGTGTTSICVNTASALAKADPHAEIILTDMVFPIGTVGQTVGLETRETIAKLTHMEKGNLQPAIIERYISTFQRWGYRVLVGASDPQEATSLEVSQIVPLFETLQQMFDYIFVDFGRALSRISIPVLEMSDDIIIILTPDTSTVRMTRLILQYLESLGISHERLVLINNRTVGRVWISKEESEKELGLAFTATIPYEQEYFTMAVNSGVPFFNKFPDNVATLMFTDVARLLRERVGR